MKLNELNPNQISELKMNLLSKRADDRGGYLSYEELAAVDDLISMDDLQAEYGATDFVPDDFFCSCQNSLNKCW